MNNRVLTGLQCTADQFHLGNYFGAIKPMIDFSDDKNNEMFLMLVNMHSFTSVQDGAQLRHNALNTIRLYLASIGDRDNFFIYNQADVPALTQLTWVFSCLTNMGTMERMHAFKDKVAKGKANAANVGLFTYPILMAADILMFDANVVPVGKDQKQHVELARDLASKFNRLYGDTFVEPTPVINERVAVVPGIDGRKMSKSYNNYIGVLDDEKTVLKRVKQIATDTKTVEESKDPDQCNVYNILKLFLDNHEDEAIRKRYLDGGLSYKEVKDYLYEKITAFILPLQKRFNDISEDDVKALLAKNAIIANEMANTKIKDIYKKVGFSL